MRRHAWNALWGLAVGLTSASCVLPYSQTRYSSYSAGYSEGYAAGYGADDVSFDVFYSQLDPYGEWLQVSGLGWVWRPSVTIVGPGFRPYYTGGRWVYTSWGWQFQSMWAWGATTFHYGRWAYDPFHGWVWAPGYEWGPAWVSWRYDGGYVAWAPLPPPGFGFSAGIVWHSVPRQRFYRHWVEPRPSQHERVRRYEDPGRVTRVVPDRPVPVQPRRLDPGARRAEPSRPFVEQPHATEPGVRRAQPARPYAPPPRAVVPAPQRAQPSRPAVRQQRSFDFAPRQPAQPRAVERPAGRRIDAPRPTQLRQAPPQRVVRPDAGPRMRPPPNRGR